MNLNGRTYYDRVNLFAGTNVDSIDGIYPNHTINASDQTDGRDLAADGAKLDGIESGATADQSNAEIETAYNTQVGQVSSGEKTAGTETGIRRFAPKDIADMASTHGGGGSVDLKPYCATGSGINITTSAATMDVSTEQVSDANYSLSSDEITITDAATYRISWSILIEDDGTSGASRGRVTGWVEDDTVKITQSECGVYHRETDGGTGTSNSFIATIGANSVLRLRAQASSSVDCSQGVSQISIEKLT